MGTAGSFLSPKQLECASAHICHFGGDAFEAPSWRAILPELVIKMI